MRAHKALELSLGHLRSGAEQSVEPHVRIEEFTRVRDVHRGLILVSCQDPDLDAGVGHGQDCFRDLFLDLVLDGRHAQEDQVLLEVLGQRGRFLLPVIVGVFDVVESGLEFKGLLL